MAIDGLDQVLASCVRIATPLLLAKLYSYATLQEALFPLSIWFLSLAVANAQEDRARDGGSHSNASTWGAFNGPTGRTLRRPGCGSPLVLHSSWLGTWLRQGLGSRGHFAMDWQVLWRMTVCFSIQAAGTVVLPKVAAFALLAEVFHRASLLGTKSQRSQVSPSSAKV